MLASNQGELHPSHHSRVQFADEAYFDFLDEIQEDATLRLLAERQELRRRRERDKDRIELDAFWL
jgi:hypothetical protein